MSVETFAVDDFIHDTLVADPSLTGKVFDSLAAQGAQPPYVVFQQQGGSDVVVANATRIMANLLYLVRVIGAGRSYKALKALANTVDQLLDRASGSNVDGVIYMCVREGVLKRSYTEPGGEVREIGLFFRIHAQGA